MILAIPLLQARPCRLQVDRAALRQPQQAPFGSGEPVTRPWVFLEESPEGGPQIRQRARVRPPQLVQRRRRGVAERLPGLRGEDVLLCANLLALVEENTEGQSFGFVGEKGVNVLTLNLDLDERFPAG